jgi:hypothetical protein
MARYWVVGGIYTDTSFTRLQGGGAEERAGPFATHEQAKAEWQRRAWATVDDAHARYRIEEEDAQAAAGYWVVGGIYKDTRFAEPAEGAEQWYGPFATYDEAKAEWQRRAWETVDDAHARFRIEKRAGDPRRG